MKIGQTGTSFRLNIAYLHWSMQYQLIVCIDTLCKVWLDWGTWVNSIHANLEKNSSLFFLQIWADKCIWQQIFKLFLKELITITIIALLRRTFNDDFSLKSPTTFETLPWQEMVATNKNQLNYLITCLPHLAVIFVFKNCYDQLELVHSEKSSLICICIDPKP